MRTPCPHCGNGWLVRDRAPEPGWPTEMTCIMCGYLPAREPTDEERGVMVDGRMKRSRQVMHNGMKL